jgi:tetraacyldisaccharide 4'-kinase
MYYRPSPYQYFIILLLLPLSLLYGAGMLVRRMAAMPKSYGIPIVSVGNLIVGGSGKTPFAIALAARYPREHVAIVSRGYGRESRGLVEVSREGEIAAAVEQSGDEPMLMAQSLPHASVIVAENRSEAIAYARSIGASLILLDDGFNRVDIKKFEILLFPEHIANPFPFPAGPMREFSFAKRYADLCLYEGKAFTRQVETDPYEGKLLLVTAIANPKRLDPYLPKAVVGRVLLEDHAYFDETEIAKRMYECGADALLVTQKDAVKMAHFKLPVVQMRLKLDIEAEALQKIDLYIKKYKDSNGA